MSKMQEALNYIKTKPKKELLKIAEQVGLFNTDKNKTTKTIKKTKKGK